VAQCTDHLGNSPEAMERLEKLCNLYHVRDFSAEEKKVFIIDLKKRIIVKFLWGKKLLAKSADSSLLDIGLAGQILFWKVKCQQRDI
jgi:hypothetical protein